MTFGELLHGLMVSHSKEQLKDLRLLDDGGREIVFAGVILADEAIFLSDLRADEKDYPAFDTVVQPDTPYPDQCVHGNRYCPLPHDR